MSTNNPLKRMVPENRNYRLYKAKKQWITACATVLVALGTTVAFQGNAQAAKTDNAEVEQTTDNTANHSNAESGVTNRTQSADSAVAKQVSANSDVSDSVASDSQKATKAVGQSRSLLVASNFQDNNESLPENVSASLSRSQAATLSAATVTSTQAKKLSPSQQDDKSSKDSSTQQADTSATLSSSTAKQATSSVAVDTSKASATQKVKSSADQGTTTLKLSPQQLKGSANAHNAELLRASARENHNIAPEIIDDNNTSDDGILREAIIGNEHNPADFLKNGQALLNSGAKITWADGQAPTFEAGSVSPVRLKVTYKDGTSVTVTSQIYGQGKLDYNSPTTPYDGQKHFYYVPNIGQTVTDVRDTNGNKIEDLLVDSNSGDLDNYSYSIDTPWDTSTAGLHWGEITVHDLGNPNIGADPVTGITQQVQIIGQNTYTIKVPYIVKGLVLRDDVTKDAAGNPTLNADPNSFKMNNSDASDIANDQDQRQYFLAYLI